MRRAARALEIACDSRKQKLYRLKGPLHCCVFLFRVFFRQHFHMKAILYCGIDPDKRYHEYAVAHFNHTIECSRELEYLTCFRKKYDELREGEMVGTKRSKKSRQVLSHLFV